MGKICRPKEHSAFSTSIHTRVQQREPAHPWNLVLSADDVQLATFVMFDVTPPEVRGYRPSSSLDIVSGPAANFAALSFKDLKSMKCLHTRI